MISVIIPLYNAINYLEPLLNKLAKQTATHELILIDSTSTDGTSAWLQERNIPFHSIPTATFNHGSTRNLGVSLATGNYVVMLTQDALPAQNDSLEQLVAAFESNPDVALAYGRQLPYPDATLLSQFARQTNYPPDSQIKTLKDVDRLGIRTCHCSNSFAAYRKSSLQSIGGFPADVILGEDVVVGAQFILKGLSIAYRADAGVVHSHNYTIIEEFKRYFDIGAFHQQRTQLLQPFMRAESEGLRYVLGEWRFLRQQRRIDLIPDQCVRTLAKYVGYRLGRVQQKLPHRLKPFLSMHRSFWTQSFTEGLGR
jgi:rhamnosyltransferase